MFSYLIFCNSLLNILHNVSFPLPDHFIVKAHSHFQTSKEFVQKEGVFCNYFSFSKGCTAIDLDCGHNNTTGKEGMMTK